jgi:hypothetical protein
LFSNDNDDLLLPGEHKVPWSRFKFIVENLKNSLSIDFGELTEHPSEFFDFHVDMGGEGRTFKWNLHAPFPISQRLFVHLNHDQKSPSGVLPDLPDDQPQPLVRQRSTTLKEIINDIMYDKTPFTPTLAVLPNFTKPLSNASLQTLRQESLPIVKKTKISMAVVTLFYHKGLAYDIPSRNYALIPGMQPGFNHRKTIAARINGSDKERNDNNFGLLGTCTGKGEKGRSLTFHQCVMQPYKVEHAFVIRPTFFEGQVRDPQPEDVKRMVKPSEPHRSLDSVVACGSKHYIGSPAAVPLTTRDVTDAWNKLFGSEMLQVVNAGDSDWWGGVAKFDDYGEGLKVTVLLSELLLEISAQFNNLKTSQDWLRLLARLRNVTNKNLSVPSSLEQVTMECFLLFQEVTAIRLAAVEGAGRTVVATCAMMRNKPIESFPLQRWGEFCDSPDLELIGTEHDQLCLLSQSIDIDSFSKEHFLSSAQYSSMLQQQQSNVARTGDGEILLQYFSQNSTRNMKFCPDRQKGKADEFKKWEEGICFHAASAWIAMAKEGRQNAMGQLLTNYLGKGKGKAKETLSKEDVNSLTVDKLKQHNATFAGYKMIFVEQNIGKLQPKFATLVMSFLTSCLVRYKGFPRQPIDSVESFLATCGSPSKENMKLHGRTWVGDSFDPDEFLSSPHPGLKWWQVSL